MKFEFKPSDKSTSFMEYSKYLIYSSPFNTIYYKVILAPAIIAIVYIIINTLSQNYKYIPFYAVILIVIILIFILILLLIGKCIKNRKNKNLKNNQAYCDLESTFKFTIDENYITRENEFTTIKVFLNKVEKIKLLKHGLIVCAENENITMLIPNEVLPVSLGEFIDLFRKQNKSIIIEDVSNKKKNDIKKRTIILGIIIILSIISSYFIGKYDYENNFTRYDLIMEKDLVKQENNKYLYENEKLGLEIYFPSKWEGKYGIEETEDSINVYYLVNGEQSNKTTLLFTIVDSVDIPDQSMYNFLDQKANLKGVYNFYGPKIISLPMASEEHFEYLDMCRDIRELKIK